MGEPMTPDDRDRLRELAERATPGPWDKKYVYEAVRHIARNCDFVEGDDPEFGWDRYNDSPFIAAAHPQTILALLDDLRDAEAERGRLRAALEKIAPQDCFCQEDGRDDLTCPRCIATTALAPDPPAGT